MFSKVLTTEQIDKIHASGLEILQRVGVQIPHDEMLNMFADSGAEVDLNTQRVRIPPELVEKSIKTAGKQFVTYGRDISRKAEFGCGKRNYTSTAGHAMWIDEVSQPRRYTTLDDVAVACRLADAMDGLTISGAMSDPNELPSEYRCVEVLASMIRNTTKPLAFWLHDRPSAKYLLEMTTALRGSEQAATDFPLWHPFFEPISPLRFPFDGIDLLFETGRFNLPVSIGPMAQMGLSAPGTLGGTMAVEHAEILAGICITQLIREGTPVCYGGVCHAFDMRTTQMIFAGPEQAIFGVAMTQMGKHLNLPVSINVGLTDSKRPDAQAGLETGTTLALGAAAGADIFGHMGICGVDQASSLDKLVLQEEVISYVESVMRNVEITDETLGLDVIEQAGPGGTFIDKMHTVEHFRNELWFPKLLDRNFYQAWLDGGATDTAQRCRERKQHLLATHRVEPIDDDLDRELDKIVAAARRHLLE